jgi:hypothetical protein
MQITVLEANNLPPIITPPIDTCIEAGKSFQYLSTITATDDPTQIITLTATGGPFLLTPSPAKMSPSPANGQGSVYQTGSTESDNRYAGVLLAASATPSQRLHFIDPDKGRVTAAYKIWLD